MKVEFHSGVPDKLGFACKLLRKAQAQGAPVVVSGERQGLDRLDVMLWTFDALSFVAHARLRAGARPAATHARSTLWLADEPRAATHREALVNLGPELAEGWQEFARVIEVVGAEPDDRDAGRARWRAYGQVDGVECENHAWGAQA